MGADTAMAEATLMRMANINEPEAEAEFQGRDLLARVAQHDFPPFVVSELYPPANAAMWEKKVPHFADTFREKHDRTLRSIRTHTHKYIWASRGPHELYDLIADPSEEQSLIDIEPLQASQLREQLERFLNVDASTPPEPSASTPTETDDQVLQRLRDLGYIA